MKTCHNILSALVVLTLLSGCSSSNLPSPQLTASMATADEAVKQARAEDSQEFAPLELQMAEQKMKDAHLAVANKNPELAGRLADQAMIDAKLASIKSRNAKQQEIVRDLQRSIQTLREEIERAKKG
ncbi:MAG: DUF4398 domain-containing protein [Candidatus Paceibacterota bacterium]